MGNNQLSNCLALNNSLDTTDTYDGFHNDVSTGTSCQFDNCQAFSQSTNTEKHRYGFYDALQSASLKNIYTNCKQSGATTGPVYLPATHPAIFEIPDGGAQIAFADGDTTPSVKPYEMHHCNFNFANTNPTTVTDFDDGLEGQIIRVTAYNTNTTIQNGTNIWTASGSDITSVAWKMYCFQYRAGYWYQI